MWYIWFSLGRAILGFFFFWEMSALISIEVGLIVSLPELNNVVFCLFSHSTCSLLTKRKTVNVVLTCLLWWGVLLSIFSYAYLPFAFPFLWTVLLTHLSIIGCLLLLSVLFHILFIFICCRNWSSGRGAHSYIFSHL